MDLTQATSKSPVVFRLAAALDRYEMDFEELVASWFDWRRCLRVTRDLDEIQKLRGALPQLAVDMTDVVIRHVELVRSLLRMTAAGPEPAGSREIENLHSRHRAAIENMRSKCLRLITRQAR